MVIFKFKYDKTKRLFKLTIIITILLIFLSVLALFIAKLYLPKGLIKSFDIHGFLQYGYLGLFLITFLGGTIFPLGSPAAVAAAAMLKMPPTNVIIISAIGYTLGALVNYYLGYKFGSKYVEKKISKEVYEDVVEWWNEYGILLVILFALLPILPLDLLALVCGVFRFNLIYFIIINFGGNFLNSYLFVIVGEKAGAWLGFL
jgi:membrane protein YqaA with SNARE-associated domain